MPLELNYLEVLDKCNNEYIINSRYDIETPINNLLYDLGKDPRQVISQKITIKLIDVDVNQLSYICQYVGAIAKSILGSGHMNFLNFYVQNGFAYSTIEVIPVSVSYSEGEVGQYGEYSATTKLYASDGTEVNSGIVYGDIVLNCSALPYE